MSRGAFVGETPMRYGFINNFATTLSAGLSASETSMDVSAGGADLANAGADLVYTLTLFNEESGDIEIIHVVSASGDTLTIERAKEGTSAQLWPSGSAVEMRLTAGALGGLAQNVATGDSSVAIGSGVEASALKSTALGSLSTATGVNSFASGEGAQASASNSVAVGVGTTAKGSGQSIAIGSGTDAALDDATRADKGNYSAGAYAAGDYSISLGRSARSFSAGDMAIGPYSTAEGGNSTALGGSASSAGNFGSALGSAATADGDNSVALGFGKAMALNSISGGEASEAYGESSIALGNSAVVGIDGGDPTKDGASSVALGHGATATGTGALAFGPNSDAAINGGLQINGLAYLPNNPDVSGIVAPEVAHRATQQVVIGIEDIDLTAGNDVQSLDLPADTILFIDAIEVVITGSDTPGGAPEVQVGTGAGAPADLLAATALTKTAIGGRDKFSPLTDDGVTAIRAEVTTTGTGTTYQARVIVKGYVMEL